MSNGDGRPLHTSSRLQALISELKCGILLVGPSPCGLRQRGFQPAVSLSDPAAFALSGAAIIAGAHAGPRKPDGDNWEKGPLSLISIPISARILAAASLPIPGTRTDQFHRLGVRRQFLPNLLVEFFDHLFNKLHMFQRLSDEQAMMIAHAVSFQRFHNLRDFPPQRSSSQIGHLFWD